MMTIDKITNLSDEQLWTLVEQHFASPQDIRLGELTTLGKQQALDAADQAELDTLIQAYDQFVLIRSQARIALKQRGYDVEQRLKQPNNPHQTQS